MQKKFKLLDISFYSIDTIFIKFLVSKKNLAKLIQQKKYFNGTIFSRQNIPLKYLLLEELEINLLTFTTLKPFKKMRTFKTLLKKVSLLKRILFLKGSKIFNLKLINEEEFIHLILINSYIKAFLISSKDGSNKLNLKDKDKENLISLSLKALVDLEEFLIQV
jgi:hypothetical protein